MVLERPHWCVYGSKKDHYIGYPCRHVVEHAGGYKSMIDTYHTCPTCGADMTGYTYNRIGFDAYGDAIYMSNELPVNYKVHGK